MIKNRFIANEIILCIIKKVDNIEDIINIYESKCFYNFNSLINMEIEKYLNMDYENRKKHFLHNSMGPFLYRIEEYLCGEEYIDGGDNKKIIKLFKYINKVHEEHKIYKKIIDFYLKCKKCKYKIKKDKSLNFCKCDNCDKVFCSDCYIVCKECGKYNNLVYCHCLYCKGKCCLKIIKNKIDNINNMEKHQRIYKTDELIELKESFIDNLVDLMYKDEIYDSIIDNLDF